MTETAPYAINKSFNLNQACQLKLKQRLSLTSTIDFLTETYPFLIHNHYSNIFEYFGTDDMIYFRQHCNNNES